MRPSALPRPRCVALVAICVALVASTSVAVPAQAAEWIPPVDGPVVRPFVEPISTYAAGHRGVDFAAAAGSAVRAANDGVVSFAGPVAGALHVVVAHDGGIRTSYSFLASADVRTGQQVERGQVLGRAGGSGEGHGPGVLHFGVRIGERYVDPMLLFQPRDLTQIVRLVPAEELAAAEKPDPRDEVRQLRITVAEEEDDDCAGIIGDVADVFGLGGAADSACDAVESVVDVAWRSLRSLGEEVTDLVDRLEPVVSAVIDRMRDVGEGLVDAATAVVGAAVDAVVAVIDKLVEYGKYLYERLTSCPQPAPKKHPKGSGNLVMAVGGLGSSRRQRADGSVTSSFHLDAKVLGYQKGQVSYFSYRADSAVYSKSDTEHDLHDSARELGRQLQELGRTHPGQRVDLIAHSQGGVVIDIFLTEVYRGHEHEYPAVANVVTFASPHEGTPLANMQAEVDENFVTSELARFLTDAPLGSDPLRQLREGSATIRRSRHAPFPKGIRFLSIAGSEDPVVPSSSADPPAGEKVVVQAGDAFVPDDHSAILRDSDALSAAQAHLSGGTPAATCGPLVDAQGEVASVVVRGATAAIDAMNGAAPQPAPQR